MDVLSNLANYLRDFLKGGPNFFLGGIFSGLSRAQSFPIKLNGGERILVRPGQSDFATLRQVFRDQEYSLPSYVAERVHREYERICADNLVPVVIDAGANIGAAAIWLKTKFPKATVVAIEPDPDNASMTRANVAGFSNIFVLEAAVGGVAGFVSIIPAEQAWAIRTERADTGCEIVTIDEALATVPLGRLLIVKIDIEGFEKDLFAGDLRWMDDAVVIYIEPHDWMLPGKGSSRGFQAAFGKRNFDIFLRGENLVYVRTELLRS